MRTETKLAITFLAVGCLIFSLLVLDRHRQKYNCEQSGGVQIRGHCVQGVKVQ